MDVLETNGNFIIRNRGHALYCDRLLGRLSINTSDKIDAEWNPVCLGQVDGVIGKLRYNSDSSWRLFLIQKSEHVGFLPDGSEIRRIVQVCSVLLSTLPPVDLNLQPCDLDHPHIPKRCPASPTTRPHLMNKMKKHFKPSTDTVEVKRDQQRFKYEKRVHDELIRLFQTDDESNFYFSPTGADLTTWTQRKCHPVYWTGSSHPTLAPDSLPNNFFRSPTQPRQPTWRRADNRFFWNLHLLAEALADADCMLSKLGFPLYGQTFEWTDSKPWSEFCEQISDLEALCTPIVQGYVEMHELCLSDSRHPLTPLKSSPKPTSSRKSSAGSDQSLSSKLNSVAKKHSADKCIPPIVEASKSRNRPLSTSDVIQPASSIVDFSSDPKHSKSNSRRGSLTTFRIENHHRRRASSDAKSVSMVKIILFSRRSKYRAGTRYRRRGIDADGNVANYVETEQILQTHSSCVPHTVAFLQIRGSVPLFWSQSGFKYRPPINLEQDDTQNQAAFKKHWDQLLTDFHRVVIVNLLDSGKNCQEYPLFEAFIRHLLLLDHEQLTCMLFDFHDYCRGMHFENVSILLSNLMHVLHAMKFCWVSPLGTLCEQQWIFRVNCLDSLDRTNLVQCMFAGVVMATQLQKFGLIGPDDNLPTEFMQVMQRMWANNGDAISQQYAGTNAMKGDYTRTGERTVNGVMRDGFSSVNRYYLRFREISRQAAIDLLLGNALSTELAVIRSGAGLEAGSLQSREESLKLLIRRCRQELVGDDETNLSECLLISYSSSSIESQNANTLLLLTDRYLHFIRIDYPITRSQTPIYVRLPVNAVSKIELGLEPSLFRARKYVLRLFYTAVLDKEITNNMENDGQPNTATSVDSAPNSKIGLMASSSMSVFNGLRPVNFLSKTNSKSDSNLPLMLQPPPCIFELPSSDSDAEIGFTPGSTARSENTPSFDGDEAVDGTKLTEPITAVDLSKSPSLSASSTTSSRTLRLSRPDMTPNHFLSFLQPDVRLFNSVLVPVPPGDENFHSLYVISAMILVSVGANGRDLELSEPVPGEKLKRLRQAQVPANFQPPIDAEHLFTNTGMNKWVRDRRRSTKLKREDASGLEKLDSSATVAVESLKDGRPPCESLGRMNKIKEQFSRIKLPEVRLRIPKLPSMGTDNSQNPSSLSFGAEVSSMSEAELEESEVVENTRPNRFFADLARKLQTPLRTRSSTQSARERSNENNQDRLTDHSRFPADVLLTSEDEVGDSEGCDEEGENSDSITSYEGVITPKFTSSVSVRDFDGSVAKPQLDNVEEDDELATFGRERVLACTLSRITCPTSPVFPVGIKEEVDSSKVNRKNSVDIDSYLLPTSLSSLPISSERNLKLSKSDTNLFCRLSSRNLTSVLINSRSVSVEYSDQSEKPGSPPPPRSSITGTQSELPSKSPLLRTRSEHSLCTLGEMPAIHIPGNPKQTERLAKKQFDTMLRLDELRVQSYSQGYRIHTSFIVF